MTEHQVPLLTLNDGMRVPAVAFGTYKLNGSAGIAAMLSAMEAGYRWLDSAFNYENEGAVGRAVEQSGLPREALVVASKLPGRRHDYQAALETIEESLLRARMSYYDLYLIHWPNPRQGKFIDAWRALIEARARGWVRSIAVCNFMPEHLEALEKETGVIPSVNQIELHPRFSQDEQRHFDLSKGILTQGWSPLGRASDLLRDPVLEKVAAAHGRSVGQVILRWALQLRVVPTPKSATPERQRENLSLFDFALDDEEMAMIGKLARLDGRLKNQDPRVYEEF